jgi:DNA polymerase I-like protein with 3'-5' exonuclease and polymerase domains
MSSSPKTAKRAWLTPEQLESVRRFFARLQSEDPKIKEMWIADSEFHSEFKGRDSELMDGQGGRPVPVCFVFYNPITGEVREQFYRKGEEIPEPPISLGNDTLLIAYTATAELTTQLALWGRMSSRPFDLAIEWLHIQNEDNTLAQMKKEARNAKGSEELSPLGLLGVCALHGVVGRSQSHKEEMRRLILTGKDWTPEEERKILDYCSEDVQDTAALLANMWKRIPDPVMYCKQPIDGIKAAIWRGRTMTAFAWMEFVGIPIDVEMTARLSKHWQAIMEDFYSEIRDEFPIFNEDSFDIAPSKFTVFLKAKGWFEGWPMTKGGKKGKKQPKKDMKRTLPNMALKYPELKKLTTVLEIRAATKLGLRFPVGPDNRHRVNFWPFGAVTSRCVPSSALFMLSGGSPAFRHLAKPASGEILIEADFSAQEVWVAAYLSGDTAMQKMLQAADPYIQFGEMAGVIPAGSLAKYGAKKCKEMFPAERARLKSITLGVLYGKTHYTVAAECGITEKEAKDLLRLHKRLFPQFWLWIEWMVNESLATRKIATKLGWQRWLLTKKERNAKRDEDQKHKKVQNSLRNFPMQSHGAEILRLALVYATEKGLSICAPLHDAIFAVAPANLEEWATETLKDCMERAAVEIIGVKIPVEMFIVRYPDRFVPDDKPMAVVVWDKMMVSLKKAERKEKENGKTENNKDEKADEEVEV